jgi:hypothetical protein
MITIEQAQRIEHKLDLIIDYFQITDLPKDMKTEIKQKVLEFQKKRKYNGSNERETIRRR